MTKKSPSELLIPRFRVVETYPKSPFIVGSELNRIPRATNDHYTSGGELLKPSIMLDEINTCPHIFKPLMWWENRVESEMPDKLISFCEKNTKEYSSIIEEVFNIESWDMKYFNGVINSSENRLQVCSLLSWNPLYGYIPFDENVTESEIDKYFQSIKTNQDDK